MDSKKGGIFFFGIIAIVVGGGIIKQFDFETFKFENLGLSIVYIITFAFSAYFLLKSFKKDDNNQSN